MEIALLPQNESESALKIRQDALAKKKSLYRWDHHSVSPFSVVKKVPSEESYSVEYHTAMISYLVRSAENLAHVPGLDPKAHLSHPSEYQKFFPILATPEATVNHYWKDWFFGEQRLAGCNPMTLCAIHGASGLSDLRTKMPVEDSQLAAFLPPSPTRRGKATLQELAEMGRLFVADYELLDDLPQGHWMGGLKYMTAPLALFLWRSTGLGDAGELVPLAIQLHQEPGPKNPIFTSRDQEWPLAKLFVQVADANHHEMASHLAGTHLAVEPFAIATKRNLAPSHPIAQLLKPHLRYTVARNREAQLRLINPDGAIDELLASTLHGSLEIARRSRSGFRDHAPWGLFRNSFESHLKSRGLLDPEVLPHFPYRDDGLLVWKALSTYVRGYLECVYSSDAVLVADQEIQNWAKDLADPDGGSVPEMPSSLESLEQLAKVLATVLFTAGPQHAATNFPQYPSMGMVSNMPLAAYQPPPDSVGSGKFDEDYLLKTLPPQGLAAKQLVIVYNLSAYRHDKLGHFPEDRFDAKTQGVRDRLKADLALAEETIRRRNKSRRFSYEFLLPSLIPNSISV